MDNKVKAKAVLFLAFTNLHSFGRQRDQTLLPSIIRIYYTRHYRNSLKGKQATHQHKSYNASGVGATIPFGIRETSVRGYCCGGGAEVQSYAIWGCSEEFCDRTKGIKGFNVTAPLLLSGARAALLPVSETRKN